MAEIWYLVTTFIYRYAILWEAFLDPSDSYFLFADLVGFYAHWTYMRGYHKWALVHSSSWCYRYTLINVHALFHMYMCYICYVISRRRLHKLVKRVSYPFCLYEQIKLLWTKLRQVQSLSILNGVWPSSAPWHKWLVSMYSVQSNKSCDRETLWYIITEYNG
jgi:hypothetical protein